MTVSTFLFAFSAKANEQSPGCVLQILEIKSLIGYFHLDPNKVAALLLDIWQDQWANEAYLCLLPLFSTQAISASLAFTFINYQVRCHYSSWCFVMPMQVC